jgi:hypothetical protein
VAGTVDGTVLRDIDNLNKSRPGDFTRSPGSQVIGIAGDPKRTNPKFAGERSQEKQRASGVPVPAVRRANRLLKLIAYPSQYHVHQFPYPTQRMIRGNPLFQRHVAEHPGLQLLIVSSHPSFLPHFSAAPAVASSTRLLDKLGRSVMLSVPKGKPQSTHKLS